MSGPMSGGNSEPKREEGAQWHGAQMDFAKAMTYGDYLHLDQILSAQHPLSPDHNEMLFIIQHQTSELWIKLALHELHAARECVRADDLPPTFKMLARVSRIMEQLVHAWDVLSTMTPPEYTAMRPYLGMSSGFQSFQYRQLEFILGNKNAAMLQPHAHRAEYLKLVEDELNKPSLYDEAIRLMARKGLSVDVSCTDRNWSEPRAASKSVEAAWIEVYRDPTKHWELYELGEKFVDLEDAFRQWRFRHLTTVERVIGFKRGTGGTPGVDYLRKMLDTVLFPELWTLRTQL